MHHSNHKENGPKVIVAIPSYNRVNRLKSAILSLQNQKFSDFQIFIFDNASTDNTELTVKDLQRQDPRIHYHRNDKNLGFSGNVQNALRILKNENPRYFTFLCDDDIFFDQHLAELTARLDENPEAAWWKGRQASYINGKTLEWQEKSWLKNGLYSNEETISALSNCDMLPFWSSVLFRTEAYKDFDLPDNFYTYEYFLIHPISLGWKSGASDTLIHMDIEHEESITYNPNFNDEWAWQGMIDYAHWLKGVPASGNLDLWNNLISKRIDARIGAFFYRHGGKQALLGNSQKAKRIASRLIAKGYNWKGVKIHIITILAAPLSGKKLFLFANFIFSNFASKLTKIRSEEQSAVQHQIDRLINQ